MPRNLDHIELLNNSAYSQKISANQTLRGIAGRGNPSQPAKGVHIDVKINQERSFEKALCAIDLF